MGSRQLDAYQAHTHPNTSGGALVFAAGPNIYDYASGSNTSRAAQMGTGTGRTSVETRPANIAYAPRLHA